MPGGRPGRAGGGKCRVPRRRPDPFLRRPFNRSALVRQLVGYLPAPPDAPRQDLAERLGQWLNVHDAIALHAAHEARPAALPPTPSAPAPRPAATRPGASDLLAGLHRLRATLRQGIAAPPARPVDPDDSAFAPHHQRCLDQQRRMETAIEPFRAHVRHTLAATSPRLARLAALDATLERLLGGREQRLLSGVPAFLKARFEQLRQTQPGHWPEPFEQELQQALVAELDLRLQPVTGLIEALAQASATP